MTRVPVHAVDLNTVTGGAAVPPTFSSSSCCDAAGAARPMAMAPHPQLAEVIRPWIHGAVIKDGTFKLIMNLANNLN